MKRRMLVDVVFAVGFALLLLVGVGVKPTAGGEGDVDPTAVLLIKQGLDLRQAGHAEGALASFDLAAQVDPASAAAHLNAARVTLEMGDPQAAAHHLQNLLLRYPEHVEGVALWSRLNAPASPPTAVGGDGFFEFGLLALVGALFATGIAAYDIGHCPPTSRKEETTEKGGVLPFCRIRSGAGYKEADDLQWIEAA